MIRVLVVDDHRLMRHGIRAVVRDAGDIEVVGEAATAAEAIRQTARLGPDVITLDIGLPDRSGLDAIPDLLAAHPRARILVLSVHESEGHVREALERGAAGYLLKDIDPGTLVEAIRSVARGQGYLSPGLVPALTRLLSHTVPKAALHDLHARGLSDREIEILLLVRRGLTDRQIAQAIHRSEGTVKSHLHSAFQKLGVRNRAEAAAFVASLRVDGPSGPAAASGSDPAPDRTM